MGLILRSDSSLSCFVYSCPVVEVSQDERILSNSIVQDVVWILYQHIRMCNKT
ncbi:hypothetical protein P689_122307 [Candidatus Riesia pediculischaeffi PTSU]|uniref:Uncharacterized protein n=1 Tax=Candidatus Riesia pediculischaeffi PTSU TaxID=1401651 RepID=A0A0C1VJ34_9ENTR|nr:hypothetical protein P689_122307 [Candidatus Riesia pediculischaeffi PTSU]